MCGRYFYSPSDMRRELPGLYLPPGTDAWSESDDDPRDVCPGCMAPVLVEEDSGLAISRMRWGFESVGGGLVINARTETIEQKPMFKPLAVDQRCAVPASRYYEWRRADRQKYAVTMKKRGLFFMAGLYRIGGHGREFVILTQPPVSVIAPIHNRMPLLMDSRDALRCWLSGEMPLFQASEALEVAPDGPEQLRMFF